MTFVIAMMVVHDFHHDSHARLVQDGPNGSHDCSLGGHDEFLHDTIDSVFFHLIGYDDSLEYSSHNSCYEKTPTDCHDSCHNIFHLIGYDDSLEYSSHNS